MNRSHAFVAFAFLSAITLGLASAGPAQAQFSLFGPPKLPDPATVEAPTPIAGNTGKFMSPFTSDGVTAEWVTKSMKVEASGQVGSMVGQYAGQEALKQVPLFGGMLGQMAGNKIGRSIALKAIGGEEFLKSSSDLSFDSLQDMSIFMYAKYSTNPEYPKILQATYAIYPEMKDVYTPAIVHAKTKS